ncbi:MAG: type II secretion system protein GspC [Marinospirillum sp.]|uniref:type II secretion system protein GspC n=1 Tax=Marinospirillum sp. TaxID=2183934 RepID=UPI0019ECC959|nr:type II secretion system protein GspC [Marinospirillum sp.]MBE0505868.1 type II secretion system protein GspC [Marinospirillum sp.]
MITANQVLRGLQPVGWLLLPLVLASLFWSGVQWFDPQPQVQVSTAENKQQKVLWINQLGHYWQPAEATSAPVRQVTQVSRLAVQVQGVFLSDQAGRSVVLLKYRNKDRTLSEGDELEQGIRLVSIRKDALVFDRNGQLEQVTLNLDNKPARQQGITEQQRAAESSNARQPAQPTQQQQSSAAVQERVGTRVLEDTFGADFRASLLRDPLQLMRYITLAPHNEGGQLQGFRINPGSDASLFNALGLQPGDLLVAVDGVAVSDTAQMMALTTRLQSASAVDVELLRGNERLMISLEME